MMCYLNLSVVQQMTYRDCKQSRSDPDSQLPTECQSMIRIISHIGSHHLNQPTTIHYVWRTVRPRSLVEAIQACIMHRKQMQDRYGPAFVRTWITLSIAGKEIILDQIDETDITICLSPGESAYKKAKRYLQRYDDRNIFPSGRRWTCDVLITWTGSNLWDLLSRLFC